MSYHRLSRFRRRIAAGAVVVAAIAPAATAEAAATDASQSPCATESPRQVFVAWGDQSWYWLAPDGGFEGGGAGWALSGGATVVHGNEPFDLNSATDSRSLSLPDGASATSAPICVRPDERIVRWVQRGPRRGAVTVEVLYLNPTASRAERVLGTVRGRGSWKPSRKLSIPLRGAGLGANGSTTVALRFTAEAGNWSLDDLYVDPRLRN
jgi:hypothetical protein